LSVHYKGIFIKLQIFCPFLHVYHGVQFIDIVAMSLIVRFYR